MLTSSLNMKKDFIEFLKEEYVQRKAKNSRYSMRAYARDLKISPSRLHQLLGYKIGLSLSAAEEILKVLNLEKKDAELFLSLVEAKHARSRMQREMAKSTLQEMTDLKVKEINAEDFSILKNWQTGAIFLLVDIPGFDFSPEWISKRLGIPSKEAQASIDDLVKHKYFEEKNGQWVRSEKVLRFNADPENQDIKHYNKQLLEKATDSVFGISPEHREISAFMLTVRKQDIDFARQEIMNFKRRLSKQLLQEGEPHDQVYCLNIQFFPIDKIQPS